MIYFTLNAKTESKPQDLTSKYNPKKFHRLFISLFIYKEKTVKFSYPYNHFIPCLHWSVLWNENQNRIKASRFRRPNTNIDSNLNSKTNAIVLFTREIRVKYSYYIVKFDGLRINSIFQSLKIWRQNSLPLEVKN